MNSRNSLKITQDELSRASILVVLIHVLDDTIKINENVCDLTPGLYKYLSSTSYTGGTKKIN